MSVSSPEGTTGTPGKTATEPQLQPLDFLPAVAPLAPSLPLPPIADDTRLLCQNAVDDPKSSIELVSEELNFHLQTYLNPFLEGVHLKMTVLAEAIQGKLLEKNYMASIIQNDLQKDENRRSCSFERLQVFTKISEQLDDSIRAYGAAISEINVLTEAIQDKLLAKNYIDSIIQNDLQKDENRPPCSFERLQAFAKISEQLDDSIRAYDATISEINDQYKSLYTFLNKTLASDMPLQALLHVVMHRFSAYFNLASISYQSAIDNMENTGIFVNHFSSIPKSVEVEPTDLALSACDVDHAARRAILSFKADCPQSESVNISQSFSDDSNINPDSGENYAIAHPFMLREIIKELLMNGLRADAKILDVNVEQIGEKVIVSVQDDGQGIPPKNLARIFDNGFTTRPEKGGTGRGLHFLKNYIEEVLGGELKVESTPGKGSIFSITLHAAECL